MGRAEVLFERFQTQGEQLIDDMILLRQSEELFLDFKRSASNGLDGRRLNDNDLNNLSKAISGFGNSEGGVIVWGVDCRSISVDPADVARNKFLLTDPHAFKSVLEGAVSGRTLPPHALVRHHVIPSSTNSNEGFVVTLIPKSSRAPHQSLVDYKYYIRTGSDFSPASHGLLAGMFGHTDPPEITLCLNILHIEPHVVGPSERFTVHLGIGLTNCGPGIAKDVYMTLSSNQNYPHARPISANSASEFFFRRSFDNKEVSCTSTDGFKLPPEASAAIITIPVELSLRMTAMVAFNLSFGAEGSPINFWSKEITASEIQETYTRLKYLSLNHSEEEFKRLSHMHIEEVWKWCKDPLAIAVST